MTTEMTTESDILSQQNSLLELSMQQDGSLRTSKIPFGWKLHTMLEDTEKSDMEDIVSWVNSGRGFKVHDLDAFMEKVVPFYFRQSKWKSFQRQLYFYGYTRASSGAYQHPSFIKGNKTLSLSMRTTKIKSKAAKRMSDNSISSKSSFSSASTCEAIDPMPQIKIPSYNANICNGEVETWTSRIDKVLLNEAESAPPVPTSTNLSDGDRLSTFGGKCFHFVFDYGNFV
ncbi:unnamed protein product [Cylindrotheca closterium]|uniref:HSF-type DNA-binding domain-containing protein n=1 Tax=Cylindrotheca closterium TaxID=2856 RepID=A0AAD2JJU4_9STRA|nr:unnamed protein product [Cylindrotheca closterium]CAJ1967874.1 unnamed protein product [Cylindrotheca closterium]